MWLLFAGTPCFAQHMNAKGGPCEVTSSDAEKTDCFAAALKKSDLGLNQIYRRVQRTVEGDDLARLRAAQRLWIQFRDSNCEAEYELYLGGSAAPMVKLACMEAMTRHRTEELETIYGWRLEKWGK